MPKFKQEWKGKNNAMPRKIDTQLPCGYDVVWGTRTGSERPAVVVCASKCYFYKTQPKLFWLGLNHLDSFLNITMSMCIGHSIYSAH